MPLAATYTDTVYEGIMLPALLASKHVFSVLIKLPRNADMVTSLSTMLNNVLSAPIRFAILGTAATIRCTDMTSVKAAVS